MSAQRPTLITVSPDILAFFEQTAEEVQPFMILICQEMIDTAAMIGEDFSSTFIGEVPFQNKHEENLTGYIVFTPEYTPNSERLPMLLSTGDDGGFPHPRFDVMTRLELGDILGTRLEKTF